MGTQPSKKIKPYTSSNEEIVNVTNKLIKNEDFDKYMELNLLFKDNLEALIDSLKCFICMTNFINLSPSCGHMGICDTCYRNKNFRYRHNCPICKEDIMYVNIILPFSENEVKIDKLKLLRIINNIDIKNIKDTNISKKITEMKINNNNLNLEIKNNEDLIQKFKEIKLENYHLQRQYNKLTRMNDILKNKINIRQNKASNLKLKLKKMPGPYVIKDI
jgi:hypothetical protein